MSREIKEVVYIIAIFSGILVRPVLAELVTGSYHEHSWVDIVLAILFVAAARAICNKCSEVSGNEDNSVDRP